MTDSQALTAMLRAKAVLLLRREGELFQLRQDRRRVELWLDVFRELSVDLHARKPEVLLGHWAVEMVGKLSFQVAAAYESDSDGQRLRLVTSQSHVPLPSELVLDRETRDTLLEQRSGRYRGRKTPEVGAIASALDLSMFFWQTLPSRKKTLCFLAGFGASSGQFFSMSDYDFSQFVLVGKHVAALLENTALIEELDRERSELTDSNSQLDRSLQSLREAQHKLVQSSRLLAEVSRQAGMAEIATGVLHNVGNVLNSVNVSAEIAHERLHRMKVAGIDRVAALLVADLEGPDRTPALRERDDKVSAYLRELGSHLAAEVGEVAAELRSVQQNIDHIKSIVGKQQAYARTALGIMEPCATAELMQDALGLAESTFLQVEVEIRRSFAALPKLLLERHKVLQILVNLISNAKNSLSVSQNSAKHITLGVSLPAPDRVRMTVSDNGAGIAPEHLPRLFTHGFTTRKNGHGFGLHTSAISAREMGGLLTAESGGLGQGATFVLELPARVAEQAGAP